MLIDTYFEPKPYWAGDYLAPVDRPCRQIIELRYGNFDDDRFPTDLGRQVINIIEGFGYSRRHSALLTTIITSEHFRGHYGSKERICL